MVLITSPVVLWCFVAFQTYVSQGVGDKEEEHDFKCTHKGVSSVERSARPVHLVPSQNLPQRNGATAPTKPEQGMAHAQLAAVKQFISPAARGNVVPTRNGSTIDVVVDDNGVELLSFLDSAFGLKRIQNKEYGKVIRSTARERGCRERDCSQFLTIQQCAYHSDQDMTPIDVHAELVPFVHGGWSDHLHSGRGGNTLHNGQRTITCNRSVVCRRVFHPLLYKSKKDSRGNG